MAFAPGQDADTVYATTKRWIDRALRADLGLFSDRPVWSPAVLADLRERIVARYLVEGDTFDDIWEEWLSDASDPTLQLAAELLWVHLTFSTGTGGERKRQLVHTTLSWMTDPVPVPPEFDAALQTGLAPAGVAYQARRKAQLRLLLEAVVDLKGRPPKGRDRLLTDPWACKAWLAGLPHDGAQSTRQVLLHLLHPATFEPIVSLRMKRRIVSTFSDHVPGYVEDVDEALEHIRGALEPDRGRGFLFTDPDLRKVWE